MNATRISQIAVIILLIVIFSLAFYSTKKVPLSPTEFTPSPSPTVDRAKTYEDMMTHKCYNEEEVETACKG